MAAHLKPLDLGCLANHLAQNNFERECSTLSRTELYKRRIPEAIQGVEIDGIKLSSSYYVPLKNGMTRARAVVFTEDLIARARLRVNYRLNDEDAWEMATTICEAAEALSQEERNYLQYDGDGTPTASFWLKQMNREFSPEDTVKIAQWCKRVHYQRGRLLFVKSMLQLDDPEALTGPASVARHQSPAQLVQSVRVAAGKTPLHSELTREYLASKKRSKNYRRALEQFREQVGDLEVGMYTPDHVWTFRNWLNETRDEKKGEKLSGQTKNNKLSAISSVFNFAIEKRYRNNNPTRDVKLYPKSENRKKTRRLYTKEELTALFVDGKRQSEWMYWSPLFGLYAGLRITEAIQLRPNDISREFGVWHFLIRPGRGQSVKGDRARAVPVHKELIRLGLLDFHKRAVEEKRSWLFADVPLVAKPGDEFNASDVERIEVPSQNAATQWFGRYSDECGVTDPNLDFHALRGTFVTYGSQQGRDLSLRMQLVGHSKGSGVHSMYIYAGASLKSLKTEIDAIRYPIKIPKWSERIVGKRK